MLLRLNETRYKTLVTTLDETHGTKKYTSKHAINTRLRKSSEGLYRATPDRKNY